jgi:hypothetical protein
MIRQSAIEKEPTGVEKVIEKSGPIADYLTSTTAFDAMALNRAGNPVLFAARLGIFEVRDGKLVPIITSTDSRLGPYIRRARSMFIKYDNIFIGEGSSVSIFEKTNQGLSFVESASLETNED